MYCNIMLRCSLVSFVQLAAIFEFGGAMLLGRVVTNTIAGGIADPRTFARQPEMYAWGMVRPSNSCYNTECE
jgi:phosphate/sulfate permease